MKIKSSTLGILILVIVFGGIGASSAMNLWITESTKVPDKIEEGQSAGEYDPTDIKGSFTFGEVSELFEIPLEDMAAAFGLPSDVDPSTFKNKDLEVIYADTELEIGTGSVRMFVALYKGLPYEYVEEPYLLEDAVLILKDKAELTQEQVEYLELHTVTIEK